MSKVFGMHTTLYWLRGMHCWWRHALRWILSEGTGRSWIYQNVGKETDWKKLTGTGQQWVAVYLSVGSKWMTGICFWMHVVDCVKGYYPFDTQIMPCRCLSPWEAWYVCRPIQAPMPLWKISLQQNVLIVFSIIGRDRSSNIIPSFQGW